MRSLFGRVQRTGYKLLVSTGAGDPPREAYVEVRRPDGRGWCARLHTPESVRTILDEWRRRGERRGELAGLYFWAPGVIVVGEITHDAVAALVEDLISEGEFELAFAPLDQRPGDSKNHPSS